MYIRFMAAIFALRHTQTSDIIATSISMFPDPENMGVTVGMVMLSCILAEISVITLFQPFCISDFRYNMAVLLITPLKKYDPEKMGVAVGVLFLACLEAEIHLG